MTKPSTSATVTRMPEEGWEFNPITHARRAVLAFLQGLFAQRPAGQWRWNSDKKQTEIFINAQAPYKVDALAQRPAITCGRGAAAFGQTVMDDLATEDLMNQIRTHTDMLSMMISVITLADEELEAEELAWFCSRHMWILRRILMTSGFHDFGRGIKIEPATPAGALVAGEGSDGWRRCQILVPAFFHYTDRIQPANQELLAGIILHMNANTGRFSEVTPAAVGIVGTGIGRLTDDGFEVPRQRLVPDENVVYKKKTPAAREPDLQIRVEV